ncbi:hypothetical protein DSO57_1016783 [Entomophthora muscae]|uniref:Uncharacterized protein n=1 Tax=Entomophthora muscae TaxID=34485 RepID=A0ACC2U2V2_9FUNG|nr:hypothetical protein DSO57_1016783 [Entomophthora muscae]
MVEVLLPPLGALITPPFGSLIPLVWIALTFRTSSLASAYGDLTSGKRRQAAPQSIRLAAREDLGSGFKSHSWARVSRGKELSILTFIMIGVLFKPYTYKVIDNSFSLETWAREQESNPNPGSPWAAGPMNCRTTCPRFSGIEPPQADTENVGPCSETGQTKEIIAPNGRLITAPNGGTEAAIISFMNLKSTPATNQEPTQERGTGLQPSPMTTTLKQDNQVAKLRFLTNERTPGPSAILLLLDPSTQFPRPWPSQCPDESPMENVKFGGGVLYIPKDPHTPNLLPFLNKGYVTLAYTATALFCICHLPNQSEISWPSCPTTCSFLSSWCTFWARSLH